MNKYKPSHVALEITLACNMRCLHCGSAADGTNRKDALSFEDWKKVIDDLNILGVEGITLSGGEPFLYPKWRELLEYINKVNPSIIKMIITNAFNITEDDIEFLKTIGLNHLGISIDGTEKTHDLIRQTKGSFKKSNQVMDWCGKHNLRYSIVTSINKLNFPIRHDILNLVLTKKPL
ncbi:MAG: radical SAM protein, partial [Elusimicrobiota bacterium]|nr:radical SAM protein [Elusimicrobiota bacterium]